MAGKPNYKALVEKLEELFSLSAADPDFTPEQRELTEHAIAVMTDLDPWLVEQAGFRNGELVAMFQRVSTAHNDTVKHLDNLRASSSWSELRNDVYTETESHKVRLAGAREVLGRLGNSIVERAKIRAMNPGQNR